MRLLNICFNLIASVDTNFSLLDGVFRIILSFFFSSEYI
jgi:hypothetical protein